MLQFEEWFRRSMRRPERKTVPVTKAASVAIHTSEDTNEQVSNMVEPSSLASVSEEMFEPENIMGSEVEPEQIIDQTYEPEQFSATEETEGSEQTKEEVFHFINVYYFEMLLLIRHTDRESIPFLFIDSYL